MKIKILKACKNDICAIYELWNDLMHFHIKLDKKYKIKKNAKAIYKKFMESILNKPDYLLLVVKQDKKIFGYSLSKIEKNYRVYKLRKYGWVMEIFVKESYRRKGVGKALYKEALEWFKRKGISVIQLDIADRNQIAKGFWYRMDFEDYQHRLYLKI